MKGPSLPPLKHATLAGALEQAARTDLGLSFVDAQDRDDFLPFRDLLARARRVAGGLAAQGVHPGDRIALVLPTGPEFVATFFGILLAGATPVPLYPPVRLGRMDEYHRRTAAMLAAVQARMVVTDSRIRRLLGLAVEQARPPLGCVLATTLDGPEHVRHVRPDALALIQFSSGTTVDPKPVALTHTSLLSNIAAIESVLDPADEPHAGVSWLPLYHDMGLVGCLLVAVARPGHLALIPPELFLARPAIWLRALARHRATISPAPNFAYGLCVKRIRDEELQGVDLSRWSLALNGAEPVAPAVLRRFIDRFQRFGFRPEALTPVYGLSEASLAVTFSDARSRFRTTRVDSEVLGREGIVRTGSREVASVGRPVAGVEISVRDEQFTELPDDRVGRVHVRGASVMSGYFARPDLTNAAVREGWLDTGDLGFIADGELHICGRAKEVVVLRGANHAPQEFEEAVDGLEGVRAGCVVAFGFVAEETGNEELALLVECDGHPTGLEEQVRARVAEATGIRPHTVVLLDPGTLPRTSSGKLRRHEAAFTFEQGTLAPPDRVTPWRLASELVKGELGHLRARLGG